MFKVFSRGLSWLLHFLYLQLFVTLISLPVLIAWGIPLSLASVVGNLFFTPFLMALLLCASLLFFFNLIGISATGLGWLLGHLTQLWLHVLSYGSPSWLIGFKKPSLLTLVGIIVITLALVHLRRIKTVGQGVVVLLIWLVLVIGFLKIDTQKPFSYTVEYKNKHVHVVSAHGSTLVIIPEIAFYPLKSVPQWIEYTLLPEMFKKSGHCTIDCLVIVHKNAETARMLVEQLRQHGDIKLVIELQRNPPKLTVNEQEFKHLNYRYNMSQSDCLEVKMKDESRSVDIVLTIDNRSSTLYSAKLRSGRQNKQKRSIHEPQKSLAHHCA